MGLTVLQLSDDIKEDAVDRFLSLRFGAVAVAGVLMLTACASASEDSTATDQPGDKTTDQLPPSGSSGDSNTSEAGSAEAAGTVDVELADSDGVGSEYGAEDDGDGSRDPSELQPVPGAVTPVDPEASGADTGVIEAGLDGLVAQAAADLASRLGIGVESISVFSATSMLWPDGSLGCPQPGMEYTQVQVEGAHVVLSADGSKWTYHSGGGRAPFLCEKRK